MSKPRKTQALSLLEGILDETAGEAAAAKVQLDEQLKQKETDAKAAAEVAEQARRAEIARRLAEEDERQSAAAERRTAALEALKVEELKAKGLWVEPEPEPVPQERPQRAVQNTAQVVEAQKSSNRGAIFAAAAVVLLLGGGAAGAYLYMNQEFVDSTTPFTATAPSMVELADASALIAFTAIPDPIEVAAPTPVAEPTSGSSRGSRSGSRSSRSGSSSDSGSDNEPSGPRLNLGGNMGGR